MAAVVAPSVDQAADLLQKISLDSQPKKLDIVDPKKVKPSVDLSITGNGQVQSYDRSLTPSLQDFMDPALFYGYAPYYYGGYDGTAADWEDYSRYLSTDGVEMTPGVYGDLYSGYGYSPYGPYSPAASPVPTMGHDGQLYGAQQYQYPPYFQPLTPASGPYTASIVPPKSDISTSLPANQMPLPVDTTKANTNAAGVKGVNNSSRQTTYQNSSFSANGLYGRGTQNSNQDPRFSFDGAWTPISWSDGSTYSSGQTRPISGTHLTSTVSNGVGAGSKNQNLRPHSNLVGLQNQRPALGYNSTSQYPNRTYTSTYPNKLYNQYSNTYRNAFGYGSNAYDTRNNGRSWFTVDNKIKPRGRGNGLFGYGNENVDGLNELNRGPRAKSTKNQKTFTPVLLSKGQNIPLTPTDDVEKERSSVVPDREQYNKSEFPESYEDAKFFIIKSYSEDDVHKSIKYSVWASTQNGNKKLDAAYQESQQKSGKCPVFLFFSVNTSGQFVGVAEMVGPVDFNKSVEYWQQDKWVGCFPVKWHVVKDLPNSLLKHIILENNENKPVTNSRDTQEVMLEQGLQVLKIFKEHSSKQCILDDFEFYEDRQKRIQEKKAKQQQFQKQMLEGKSAAEEKNKEGTKVEVVSPKPSVDNLTSNLVKEPTAIQLNEEVKISENVSVLQSGDLPKYTETVGDVPAKVAKPVVVPEKIAVNGVANGC